MDVMGAGGLIENDDPLSSSTATLERDMSTVEGFTPNRIDAAALALTEENLIGTMINFGSDLHSSMRHNVDPNFDLSKMEGIFDNVNSEYWDELESAKNEQHAKELAVKYGQMSKTARYLDDLGIEGSLYRMSSLIGDVPLISLLQKVRGVGKGADFMDKLNSSYAGRALFAGTIEGSFEGVKQLVGPADRTEMDLLLAIGAGGILGGLYNPRAFDDEIVGIIKENTQEAIETVGAGKPISLAEKAVKTIQDKQFNVTSYFSSSPSETMKNLGSRLFMDVLQGMGQDVKAIELRDAVKSSIDNAFTGTFDPVYFAYSDEVYGKGLAINKRLRAERQQEFYNLVGDLFYGRANPALDNLSVALKEQMLKATEKMGEDAYDILKRNGHTKFVDESIERTDNYVPLRWLREKITSKEAQANFKKADFVKAVINGFEKKFEELGIVVTPERIKQAADKFTARMYEQQLPVGQNGYITQNNAMKNALTELGEMLDLSPAELKLAADKIREAKNGKAKGTASATKARTPLSLDGEFVTESGYRIVLKDFVDTDIQSLWARYGHSMGGDTALRNLGIESRADLQKMRDQIVKELSGGTGVVTGENTKYLTNFDATVAHLLGMSSKADPDGKAWQTVRLLNNLTRAAKLGATWFAMSAEAARVTHRVGVANMIRSIPAMKDLINAYRGKGLTQMLRESRLFEGLSGELDQTVSIAKYEDTLGSGLDKSKKSLLDRAEKFGDAANEAVMLLGGVKSGTAILEYMHSIGIRLKMMQMAEKGMNQKAYDFFELYGFDKDTATAIAKEIKKHGAKDKNAPLLNLDSWDDPALAHRWSMAVRRQSYELVQRSNFGDTVGVSAEGKLAGDTLMGGMAMSLKNYMLVAYNKQLSKNAVSLAKGGKESLDVLGNWGYQTAFTSVAYIAKQYTQHWNDPETLEENLTPARIAANTFSMTTFSTFIPGAVDFAADAVFDQRIFNTYSRDQGAFSPAPLSFASDVVKAGSTVAKAVSPFTSPTEGELKNALSILPLSNAIGIKSLTTEIAEEFGR